MCVYTIAGLSRGAWGKKRAAGPLLTFVCILICFNLLVHEYAL